MAIRFSRTVIENGGQRSGIFELLEGDADRYRREWEGRETTGQIMGRYRGRLISVEGAPLQDADIEEIVIPFRTSLLWE